MRNTNNNVLGVMTMTEMTNNTVLKEVMPMIAALTLPTAVMIASALTVQVRVKVSKPVRIKVSMSVPIKAREDILLPCLAPMIRQRALPNQAIA